MSAGLVNCPICRGQSAQQHPGADQTTRVFRCARCGKFGWGYTMWHQQIPDEYRVNLAGYVQDQNAVGMAPEFTLDLVNSIGAAPRPRLTERAERLLSFIVRQLGAAAAGRPGIYHQMSGADAAAYSIDEADLALTVLTLKESGFLSFELHSPVYRVSPRGFMAVESMGGARSASPQGFVAMSFDVAMLPAYTLGFDPALRAAGYRALRIDNKEHSSSISDAILSEIRRSRFVVADYTHQNNGVYFEAGFAQGLGIQVIPTCQAGEIAKLHFDVRHINTLSWDDPPDLAHKLARRVSAVMGDGPLDRVRLPTSVEA